MFTHQFYQTPAEACVWIDARVMFFRKTTLECGGQANLAVKIAGGSGYTSRGRCD
jgi:hypothetical protein